MAAPASQDRLLARLRSAMGGASRIAAVSTYAREAVVRIEATGASGSPSSPARAESGGASTRSLVASLADRLSGGAGRETLVRSAPGRARRALGGGKGRGGRAVAGSMRGGRSGGISPRPRSGEREDGPLGLRGVRGGGRPARGRARAAQPPGPRRGARRPRARSAGRRPRD